MVTYSTDVWLVRHGEIASYEGDNGLTARGREQAAAAARGIAEELSQPTVELLHAPSTRAAETATALGGARADRGRRRRAA